ncbi:MAG: hypothetical protein RI560_08000 [Natronomonas sp.]|uniref:hypothetical protein n=1 Tax=Natronomonas sp. TaxID=2184060 RepID=UPI00287020A1|nr:hypothetical protein [Natronomonas sp.]MDR9381597.1 hypothetical protein [Natronomonas sp.]MDR9431513.1 hypothetical protein [Natronomonas sp.]
MTDETIRMHAAQGLSRAIHPDARDHFRAILELVDADVSPGLVECPACGKVGLRERIDGDHACIESR